MSISSVEKSGSYYIIYNEKGRKLTSLHVSKGELLGYCRAFLMLQKGNNYELYNEDAHKYASINIIKGDFAGITADDTFVLRKGNTDYMFDKDCIKINTKSKNAKWGRSSVLMAREFKAKEEEKRRAQAEAEKLKREQQRQEQLEKRQQEKERENEERQKQALLRKKMLEEERLARLAQQERMREQEKQAKLRREREKEEAERQREMRELERTKEEIMRKKRELERKEVELARRDESFEEEECTPAHEESDWEEKEESWQVPLVSAASLPPAQQEPTPDPAEPQAAEASEIARLRQQFIERERALQQQNDDLRAHADKLKAMNAVMRRSASQELQETKKKSRRTLIISILVFCVVLLVFLRKENTADNSAEVAQETAAPAQTATLAQTEQETAPAPAATLVQAEQETVPEATVPAAEPPAPLPGVPSVTPGDASEITAAEEEDEEYIQRSNVGSEEWNQTAAEHLVLCYLTPGQFEEESVDCLHFPLTYSGETVSTREKYLSDDEQYRKKWSKMTYICEKVQLNSSEGGVYSLSALYYCELVSIRGKVTRLRCRNDFKIRSFPSEGLRIFEIQESILDKNALPPKGD